MTWPEIIKRIEALRRRSRSVHVQEQTSQAIYLVQTRRSSDALDLIRKMGGDELHEADRVLSALTKATASTREMVKSRLADLSHGKDRLYIPPEPRDE